MRQMSIARIAQKLGQLATWGGGKGLDGHAMSVYCSQLADQLRVYIPSGGSTEHEVGTFTEEMWRKLDPLATPTIPTGHSVVPDEWTKIGFVERSALARIMQGSKQAETLFVIGGGCQPQDVYVKLAASPSAGGV